MQTVILASAKTIQTIDWVTSPIPNQFSGLAQKAWYCVGQTTEGLGQAYFALVMKLHNSERCAILIHYAGDERMTTEDSQDFDTAKEFVQRVLSERSVIARLMTN